MNENGSGHQRWAHLRFAVVGPLLAAPPGKGELKAALAALADRSWRHPVSHELVRFGFSTIERWYYRARREQRDPVGVLRRKLRRDAGRQSAIGEEMAAVLLAQYREHPNWSVQLHADNLRARVLASQQCVHHRKETGRDVPLDQETVGAETDRRLGHGRLFVRAEDEHRQTGTAGSQPPDQPADVPAPEREVDDHEGRHDSPGALGQRPLVRDDDDAVEDGLEQAAQALGQAVMTLRHQHG